MEKEVKKGNKWLIILLIGIIVILIGVVICLVLNKDNENNASNGVLQEEENEQKIVKIDETKDYVYMVQKGNGALVDYPVINVNAYEIMLLNDEFKTNSYSSKFIDEESCENNKINCSSNYYDYKSHIVKNNFVIVEEHIVADYYDGGGPTNFKYYVVSKETGNLLTNEEIFSLYNMNSEKVYNDFIAYCKNNKSMMQDGDYFKGIIDNMILEPTVFAPKILAPYDETKIVLTSGYGIDFLYDGTTFIEKSMS